MAAALAPLFAPAAAATMDVVVLACTHFPLLREELAAAAPRALGWVDSGAAVARRVEALLGPQGAGTGGADDLAVVTGAGAAAERMAAVLRASRFVALEPFDEAPPAPC